jgi:hypothetical protein
MFKANLCMLIKLPEKLEQDKLLSTEVLEVQERLLEVTNLQVMAVSTAFMA